mmetsp:Transcript_18568/g.30395  ORF Transcript_18568/g.30395 Transcript_18568/m.30395 type:complete len:95 (+) Transcript_18568:137-421(+)
MTIQLNPRSFASLTVEWTRISVVTPPMQMTRVWIERFLSTASISCIKCPLAGFVDCSFILVWPKLWYYLDAFSSHQSSFGIMLHWNLIPFLSGR